MATYSSKSPYSLTRQTSWYLDVWTQRAITPSASDVLITVDQKHQYRPDLLSNDLYGTVEYWWIFAIRNMDLIKDPIYDLVAGLQIYVPNPSNLATSLG